MDEILIYLDGQDRGQPDGDFGIEITLDKQINALFTTFDSDKVFSGGAYEYLYGIYQQNGYCSKVDVQVVYKCKSFSNYTLARGYILLSDCEFDIDVSQVKTKIFDDAYQTRINNNKSIPFFSNVEQTKNGESITPMPLYDLLTILPSEPTPTGYTFVKAVTVDDFFRFAVSFISDNAVEYYSDYFTNDAIGSKLALTSGFNLYSSIAFLQQNPSPFETTFADIFIALSAKLNLGFGFDRSPSGKPRIRIEDLQYFQNNSPAFTLTDVPGIKSKFDKDRIYSTIALGSDEYLNEWEGADNTEPLSFPQIMFLGYKEERFGLIGECNIDKDLNLTTQKLIIDTNLIEDILVWKNQNHQNTPVLIQFEGELTDPAIQAYTTDLYGIGTQQYNPDFTNQRQAANHISGVPNSIWAFYQGVDPITAAFEADSSNAYYNEIHLGINDVLLFDLDQPTDISTSPVLLSDRENVFVGFNVEVSDPGSNYTPNFEYIPPGPFIGQFRVRVRFIQSSANPVGQIAFVRPVISRYNPEGILIKRTFGTYINFFVNGTGDVQLDQTLSLFVNTDDRVKVDLQAYKTLAFASCGILYSDTGVGYVTNFKTENIDPIEGGELEPFDPDSYKAVIDTFTYPLGFEQIRSLIEDTTQSIAYTDTTDPAKAKRGDIVKVKIPAIGKNIAEFEVKTKTI